LLHTRFFFLLLLWRWFWRENVFSRIREKTKLRSLNSWTEAGVSSEKKVERINLEELCQFVSHNDTTDVLQISHDPRKKNSFGRTSASLVAVLVPGCVLLRHARAANILKQSVWQNFEWLKIVNNEREKKTTYFSISGAEWTNSCDQKSKFGFLSNSMKVMSRPHGWGRFTIRRSNSTLQSSEVQN
jgi:hypothetical protein